MAKFSPLLIVSLATTLVSAVFGPIGTSRPAPPGGSVANDAPPTSFWQGFNGVKPTNDWWVGYGASPAGDQYVAGPFPYQSKLASNGIQFGVSSTRQFDGTSIKQPTQVDWSVDFTEHSGNANDHKIISYDTQSVTLQYFTGSSTVTTYMVPGAPYITFNYANATPRLRSQQGLITNFGGQAVVNGGPAVTVSGTKFKVVNGGGTYIIYSLNGSITLAATAANGAGTVTAASKFNGVLRVVKLNAAGHESTLDTYSANYPTGVTTDYTFSGDNAVLSFTWTVTGNAGQLLMLSWPHHRTVIQNANILAASAISYLTTKGNMLGVTGNVWRLSYALPTITWNAPRGIDGSCTSTLAKGLEYEIKKLVATPPTAPGDFYYFGGSIAAKGRLALIAEQLGRTDLVNLLVPWLRTWFNFWFDAASPTQAAYETAWGMMINKAGYNNVWVDFGNGYGNDHHFHYGYFLAAAATIAKYDSGWRDQHREYLSWFLRDIINPSRSDPYFPVTRCRDWFAGHSWASGIANGAGSRDQESIGEAVNGYYGALLWATVIGDTNMANYARLLVATEQQAAKVYWHLYPNSDSNGRDQPYPEAGFRNLITVGNVEDWQSGAWLFWGDQKVEIAAIQILPVTPINEYMYDAEWVRNVWSYTAGEMNSPDYGDEWKSVISLAYSNADPQTAAKKSATLTSWGSGNTYSNQLYFLSTRPNPSGAPICTADTQNPEGTYFIQADSNGRYVTSSAGRPDLFADATATGSATAYVFGFAPNGGTIKAANTNQYVTADSGGTFTISAARASADAWETFTVRPKVGGSGTYTLQAASNKKWVVVNGNGALVNSAATESAGSAFRLTQTTGGGGGGPVPLPASGTLRHDASGRYVGLNVPNTDPWLHTVTGNGVNWNFPKLTVQNGIQIYGIQEADNALYVTSDNAGGDQLRAFRQAASTWEYFAFENVGGCKYNLRMTINNKLVGVRGDGTLFADQTASGSATIFSVVGAGCPA